MFFCHYYNKNARRMQDRILPPTDIFWLFCFQNEPRKKDGVTPVYFWNAAEK